jgi:hypothetical protein
VLQNLATGVPYTRNGALLWGEMIRYGCHEQGHPTLYIEADREHADVISEIAGALDELADGPMARERIEELLATLPTEHSGPTI